MTHFGFKYRENYSLLKKNKHVIQQGVMYREIYTDFQVYMYMMTPSKSLDLLASCSDAIQLF